MRPNVWLSPIIFVFLFFVSTMPFHTQQRYTLYMPSIDEYLDGLPELSTPYPDDQYGERRGRLIRDIEAEFWYRYGETARYVALHRAFGLLNVRGYANPTVDTIPAIDYDLWIERMLQAWLDENAITLEQDTQLTFDDFTLAFYAHDFDLDGVSERLVDIKKGFEDTEYSSYMIVSQVEDAYTLHRLPIAWRADGYTLLESSRSDEKRPPIIRDLTDDGDGALELVFDVAYGEFGPMGGVSSIHTDVLGWQSGSVQTYATITSGESLVFENLDDDPALEISFPAIIKEDNWGCGQHRTVIYDWDGVKYTRLDTPIEETDCSGRDAEEAMWVGDMASAAVLYDRYISTHADDYQTYQQCLQACDCCEPDRQILAYEYFHFRRIIAYALLGQSEKAQQLHADLLNDEIDHFDEAVNEVDPSNAEALCQSAFNYFANEGRRDAYYYAERYKFLPGQTREITGGINVHSGMNIDPARAGCNPDLLRGATLPTPTPHPTPFPTPIPPTPDMRPAQDIWIDQRNFYQALQNRDFEAILKITESVDLSDPFELARYRYYRAMALQALGRNDEALAEYVVIIMSNPASDWGTLAALHVRSENP